MSDYYMLSKNGVVIGCDQEVWEKWIQDPTTAEICRVFRTVIPYGPECKKALIAETIFVGDTIMYHAQIQMDDGIVLSAFGDTHKEAAEAHRKICEAAENLLIQRGLLMDAQTAYESPDEDCEDCQGTGVVYSLGLEVDCECLIRNKNR